MHAPSTDKSVIFTADDFGLADALTARGFVRTAGAAGVRQPDGRGPGTQAALNLARTLPGLCLGVHLTLIQGRAVLPPTAVPRLGDSRGLFPNNPVATGWRYFANPASCRKSAGSWRPRSKSPSRPA